MKKVNSTLMISFLIIFIFSLMTNVSAQDWELASGGISDDQISSIGAFAATGTGVSTPTANVNIVIGSGQAFFHPDTVITPNIDIYASTEVVVQVAIVLGNDQPIIAYYNPDNLLSPWSINTPVEFYVTENEPKNFNLFSFEANILASVIPGNDALKPFGIFARVLYNGEVLDQAAFASYILSPDLVLNPVTAPW